jgi:hypothetical protein
VKVATAVLVVLVVTSVFLHPFCHQIFRCGCRTLWGGPTDHCNVNAKVGPHCPWCDDLRLGTFGYLLTVVLQAAAFAVARRRPVSIIAATMVAVVALPLAMLVAGGASWLVTDYPHFVMEDARGRLGVPPGPVRTVR